MINIAYGFENSHLIDWLHGQHGLPFEWPELDGGKPTHPSTHQQIVADILKMNKEAYVSVITHSEHIILGLLLAIRKGELSRDDLRVYWVDENGALLLRVDSEGDFIDRWPHGFFDERANLLFDE